MCQRFLKKITCGILTSIHTQQWVNSLSGPDYIETALLNVKHYIKDSSSDDPSPLQFYNAFLAKWGSGPSYQIASCMAGLYHLEGAVKIAGVDDHVALLTAMNDFSSPSFFGQIAVDKFGRNTVRSSIIIGKSIYTYIYIYIYIYVYFHIFSYVYIYMYMNGHIYIICICVHKFICVHIYIYVYMYICICIFAYVHAHTHKLISLTKLMTISFDRLILDSRMYIHIYIHIY